MLMTLLNIYETEFCYRMFVSQNSCAGSLIPNEFILGGRAWGRYLVNGGQNSHNGLVSLPCGVG